MIVRNASAYAIVDASKRAHEVVPVRPMAGRRGAECGGQPRAEVGKQGLHRSIGRRERRGDVEEMEVGLIVQHHPAYRDANRAAEVTDHIE